MHGIVFGFLMLVQAGSVNTWLQQADYPLDALRNRQEGAVGIRFDINVAGRVENCTVVESSGFASLDQASCATITMRGRYSPALDQDGRPIKSSSQMRIRWELPK